MVTRVALISSFALLAFAPAAHAIRPVPTVSTGSVSVQPSLLSYTDTPRDGSPALVADGFGRDAPTLAVVWGSQLTITLSEPADSVEAAFGTVATPVTAVGDGSYTATVPADLPLPSRFVVKVKASDATTLHEGSYTMTVGPTLAPPGPPETLPNTLRAGVALAGASRMSGSRVRVPVACRPDGGPCSGRVTVRTHKRGIVLARIPFSLVPGQGKTVSALVPASVRRSLQRHPGLKLRAVIRANGR